MTQQTDISTRVMDRLFIPKKDGDFDAAFVKNFSVAPHPLGILGYDAVRVLADVAGEKQRTGQPVGELLLRPEGFYGSGGYLKFKDNGITERGLNMVKIGEQFEVEKTALNLAPLPVPENLQPHGQRKGNWW